MYVIVYICDCIRMYVCMYVCMHVCMHVCMYACIYMYTCIHVYMYTCIHVYMYTCIPVYMYTCVYIYILNYIYMCDIPPYKAFFSTCDSRNGALASVKDIQRRQSTMKPAAFLAAALMRVLKVTTSSARPW